MQVGGVVRVRISVNVVLISIIRYPQKAIIPHVAKLLHSEIPIPQKNMQTRITTGSVNLPVAIST